MPISALAVIASLSGVTTTTTDAADWPTYQQNHARTAVTLDKLAFPLERSWAHQSRSVPHLAWPGPAKWDGYHKIRGLKDRMTFDRAYHVVVAGGSAYFGSSSDDKVYCLDTKSGKTRWTFFTEGPVRFAPTVAEGLVYVGSDDGHAYCLDAKSGKLVWKQRLGPKDLRIPGNGRWTSMWPVRTGVVVLDGSAYCCGGVFPWEGVYLASFDAKTGERRWLQKMTDLPAQGYLLASPSRLYVMTARERPVVFDRRTGKRLYQVKGGGGGTYALISGDTLVYGPGKTGDMSLFTAGQKDQLASFPGNQMIVTPKRSYLRTDTSLAALDRSRYLWLLGNRRKLERRKGELGKRAGKMAQMEKALLAQDKQFDAREKARQEAVAANPDAEIAPPTEAEFLSRERTKEQLAQIRKDTVSAREEIGTLTLEIKRLSEGMRTCYPWRVELEPTFSMILAGNAVVLGGRNQVIARSPEKGEVIWKAEVPGDVYSLVVSNGRLYASTDRGTIVCFAGGKK